MTREPRVGDYVVVDGHKMGELLREDDGFKDSGFPGCSFRLPDCRGLYELAVNVKVTGKVADRNGHYRCKVEFVGDCEESTFVGGTIFFHGDNS